MVWLFSASYQRYSDNLYFRKRRSPHCQSRENRIQRHRVLTFLHPPKPLNIFIVYNTFISASAGNLYSRNLSYMELTLILGISVLALLFAAFYLIPNVLKRDTGTPAMQEISNAIKQGAEAFLRRQNKTI